MSTPCTQELCYCIPYNMYKVSLLHLVCLQRSSIPSLWNDIRCILSSPETEIYGFHQLENHEQEVRPSSDRHHIAEPQNP